MPLRSVVKGNKRKSRRDSPRNTLAIMQILNVIFVLSVTSQCAGAMEGREHRPFEIKFYRLNPVDNCPACNSKQILGYNVLDQAIFTVLLQCLQKELPIGS